MPPKRAQATASNRDRESTSSPDPTDDTVNHDSTADPPPFFNVSFSTHRVSPLYIGKDGLTTERLDRMSRRLRDTLVGDVVRGVQVGLEGSDTSLGRAGSLERIKIRRFDVEAMLRLDGEESDRPSRPKRPQGLCFEMAYENALCTAILVPQLGEDKKNDKSGRATEGPFEDHQGTGTGLSAILGGPAGSERSRDKRQFLHLPLLLMRMPTTLKPFIIDFVARNFDCRITPLALGTKSIVSAWEHWLDEAGLPSRGPLAKDVVMTLGFHIPPDHLGGKDAADKSAAETSAGDASGSGTALRSVDVIIPFEALSKFVDEGETLQEQRAKTLAKRKASSTSQGWEDDARKRSKLAGHNTEEGWGWRKIDGNAQDPRGPESPFIEALGKYLENHLALNLFHPGVRVTKMACGGFALAESRVKMLSFSAPNDSEEMQASAAVRAVMSVLTEQAGPPDT